MATPNTCPTLEAGSVLTNNTREPWSANLTAVAHAREVFPTPPLPVKNMNCGGESRKSTLVSLKNILDLSASRAATFATATIATFGFVLRNLQVGPTLQFFTTWITPRKSDLSVEQHQGQTIWSRALKKTFYDGIFRERHWLLRQIKSLKIHALLFHPLHIRGKMHKLLIDVHPTHASTATHGGIKYLNCCHTNPFCTVSIISELSI